MVSISTKSPGGITGLFKMWRALLELRSQKVFAETAGLTGETWVDGKPIYRKVLDCGALPNATSKNVAHGIASIGEVVALKGVANNTGTFTGALPLPSDVIGVAMTGTNITLTTASDLTAYEQCYVIIDYTLPS